MVVGQIAAPFPNRNLTCSTSGINMNETDFWKLISLLNVGALDEGDEDAKIH
jgi:hypothetical protein